jgi:hypothetical protein
MVKKGDDNVMRQPRIEKLVINICVGESGDRLTRASKVLEQLTGQKPVTSKGENKEIDYLYLIYSVFIIKYIFLVRFQFKHTSDFLGKNFFKSVLLFQL